MSNTFTITQTPDDINLYLYPNGSSSTQMIASGASQNYLCVDEVWYNPNDDTDYVYMTGASSVSDWYIIQDHTTETGSINYVKVIAEARSTEGNQSENGIYKMWIGDGSSTSYILNQAPITRSYSKYYSIFTSTPSGSSWTWNDVDNLLIGIECSSPTVTGSIKNLILRPDSNGHVIQLGATGDSPNYKCVDEEIANDNADYVGHSDAATGKYDLYNLPNHTTEQGVINYVEVFFRCKESEEGDASSRASISLGGSGYTGDWNTLSSSWTTFSYKWTSCPSSGIGWTWNDIDILEAGVDLYKGTSGSNPRCTQVYVAVNYTEDVHPEIRTTQTYAVVNYTPAQNTVTLNLPDSLSIGHSRSIQRFLFPSGDYEILDVGRSGKTFTISGVETTNADTKMQTLKTMCHYGSVVTITGMPDDNLNTDYLIVDFSFEDISFGSERKYRWTLTLEEA